MHPTTSTAVIHGLSEATANELRRRGGIVQTVTSNPGWPCRQCLRDIDVGDEALLVSYDPFDERSTSPYRTPSPVFLHRHPCTTAGPTDVPPVQLTGRLLSLRAFDGLDLMRHARVLPGEGLAAALDELFADEAVDHVHVHNAGPGCFAARATRGA